ncbi:MAG TPA: oligopeptide/dipeptide ABC transporter ATP-binding protein [Desulfomonilia bacterium]|nr:oligopeptide/dipeptide ABC transporter ATP-binding protein [Desulfomonilia bacterium]
MNNVNTNALIQVRELTKFFPIYRGAIFRRKLGDLRALDGVSFDISRGETLGLVGESGCGKTTTGRTILQLEHPTSGKVFFEGRDITGIGKYEARRLRKHMQIIYQDPFGSLNPRMTVRDIVGEPLLIHELTKGRGEYRDRIDSLLKMVGLNPAMAARYPHEFSGGERQRIGIARALAVNPGFIICDEPVSALDVSIQAQIINLLEEIQEKFGLAYLFIAHDLAVVRHISNRIAVMYLGEIVEIADRKDLYREPMHPYTKALLAAIPIPDPEMEYSREHSMIKGEVPSLFDTPPGCKFHTRCPIMQKICRESRPVLKNMHGNEHMVACHLVI